MRILTPMALVCAVSLAACASSSPPPPQAAPAAPPAAAAPNHVDGPAAHKLVQSGAILVDVRSPEEFAAKHIDGAVNVPVDEVTKHDFGGKDKPLVLYCAHGNRSARAAGELRSSGFTQVYELGAMSAWGE